MTLREKAALAERAAREAGAMLERHDPFRIRLKSENDYVTEMDLKSENMLRDILLSACPEDEFFGEETGGSTSVKGRWIVDPIDGTVNFAHGLPTYGTQCCLFEDGEPRVAAIYLPCQDEMYTAVAGQGCYLNGRQVTVDKTVTAENAVISVGDFTHKSDRLAAFQYRAVGYLYPRVGRLRMYGAATCLSKSHSSSEALMNLAEKSMLIPPRIIGGARPPPRGL